MSEHDTVKQEIAELAQHIYSHIRVDTLSRALAALLYREGFRKIPDGAVVLTKSEIEALDKYTEEKLRRPKAR